MPIKVIGLRDVLWMKCVKNTRWNYTWCHMKFFYIKGYHCSLLTGLLECAQSSWKMIASMCWSGFRHLLIVWLKSFYYLPLDTIVYSFHHKLISFTQGITQCLKLFICVGGLWQLQYPYERLARYLLSLNFDVSMSSTTVNYRNVWSYWLNWEISYNIFKRHDILSNCWHFYTYPIYKNFCQKKINRLAV